ncbi:3-isopropylmalate dehydratase small subunit 1 [uncultured Desulfobacterium sp.]|uniref:3-isopropylmalate dehydratase small subunit 1 n=1 Tax=uncultured Desulfobacterium sp. TaxID=201089 RepID=A0A445MV18_9BACT|nr:3-isopropylmalate dehydratase small subunit 1 [uncultured Desulfobacterium sp.]
MTGTEISGRVWRLGDNINTDLIHPPSCFSLDEDKIKAGIYVGMNRLERHDNSPFPAWDLIIVAGENFGCGSSRETSVRALFSLGVRAIVAKSFARIFYRSLVNRGIAPIECSSIYSSVSDGDMITVSMSEGHIRLENTTYIQFAPLDPHIKKILECGGLVSYLKRELKGHNLV